MRYTSINESLEWQHQAKMISPSWRQSVNKQRIQIERLLEDNSGLKGRLDNIIAQGYKYGRRGAIKEADLLHSLFLSSASIAGKI